MKAVLVGVLVALALAACSAGVSVGSASYSADERNETLCTQSYSASLNAQDSRWSGLHRAAGCVSTQSED